MKSPNRPLTPPATGAAHARISGRLMAALIAVSVVFLILVVAAAARFGASYEEVVPYVLMPLDIRSGVPTDPDHGTPPRFVVSAELPELAFEPVSGVRLPLLNQPYMTDHLSYGGVALRATSIHPLWAARAWHALFGVVVLWTLCDVALLLGLGARAAFFAAAIAATCLPFTFMYNWARFDESLASAAAVVALWATLQYDRSPRRGWIWVAMAAAALAVTGKLTALWILGGLALAGGLAGWRPPPLRELARPALGVAWLFAPMVGFALTAPATGNEVGRRLAFLGDLFTTDVIPGTAANLIAYLGSWGSILSEAMRGDAAHGTNIVGELLVAGALIWLVARTVQPSEQPRRRRREAQMLVVTAFIFALVALFFREHRDYQFALLVPLHTLALAAFLDFIALRLQRPLGWWAASALVLALPLASNLWEQQRYHRDLTSSRNAMFDLGAQRESAAWLSAHDVYRPIVVTFYAVGTYEIFTGGTVRPIYAYPLMRHSNDRTFLPDLPAVWRGVLAEGGEQETYAVLPLGTNPIEARHFDEPAIRAALFEVADSERVAVFNNPRGEPVLDIWKIRLRRAPDRSARPPATAAPITPPA